MSTHEGSVAWAREYAGRGHGHWIDAAWVPATGATLDVVDPGRGEVIGAIAAGDAAVVDRAVASARASFEAGSWAGLSGTARSTVLLGIADEIAADAENLAHLEALDNGMPLASARGHVANAVQAFRYYAGMADKIFGHTSQIQARGHQFLGYSLKEPIGVAALVVPWNAPLRQTVYKVAPALAAGCSMVLKPAEETSLSGLRLAELLHRAGVPSGVFNVITGEGVPVGSGLAEHPGVDKLSFTGSTEVGRSIVAASAGNLKKLTLELGGKSPLILCADADLDRAAPTVAMSIFGNSGQVCSAASRLIVHRSIHDEVVERVSAFGRTLRLGYHDQEVDLGPLVSAKQLSRVSSYVDGGVAAGAEIVGGRPEGVPGDGYFYAPTVLAGVEPTMAVAREEIFGPVLAALAFDEVDEAVALANDTAFGLAGSVFTRDVGRAHAMAARIRAGRVGINVHGITDFTMPGGGYKESGWGRENGPAALDPYLETKAVFTALDG
ncbi:aldehyde dehydrogenase family protein [Nocardioides acrostichi]|uniref:Aldehyde dehydrogenase n=1 Tax=Nocardioides acrostichi TaxID=2784339 RepID=A0A930UYM6_9ACTN|nr:aldehyde dehydrogenase family protein [Nocardioides acrostichi]MBF4163293.1 aldehyde dehydrogenase [Nocardioides acrostichi]